MANPYDYGTGFGQAPNTYQTTGITGTQRIISGNSNAVPANFLQANPYSPQLQYGYQTGMQGVHDRSAAQLDPSQQAQFRQMQMQQAQQLQGIASGQRQGAGELAVQRQVQNAMAGQQAMARMNRGASAGMGGLDAARNSAGIGLAGAGQSQQAALQDQQMAQGQLANVTNQGRGSDIGMAGQNAQLQQQMYGQNDQAQLGYLNMLRETGQGSLNTEAANYGSGMQQTGVGGGLVKGIGSMMALASDERLKTDIRDGKDDIDEMLDRLVAKTYRYKDESKYGAGPRAGIMAQNLERSRAGKALVVDLPNDPGRKGVDMVKAVSAALASAARLNQRLRKVEGRSK